MGKIVIFSGAGLSAESNIPTFRDSGGLWEGHRIEDVATPIGWQRDPGLVLNFYAQRFIQMQNCTPNPAHRAIAQLGQHFDVLCITQNIDTLLEQASVLNIRHLHGRIDYKKCEWHFSIPPMNADWQCNYRSAITEPVKMGDLCPDCGRQLRPDVVWFGEAVTMPVEELYEIVSQVEIFIGVGTSAKVTPAATLLKFFGNVSEKYFIDPNPPVEVLNNYILLQGNASEKMPELVSKLIDKVGSPTSNK